MDVRRRIRKMLASELDVPEASISDDFRWTDKVGAEDTEWFLVKVHDAFVKIPSGFSFGSGQGPFDDCVDPEEIATLTGLIARVERHVAKESS